MNKSALIIPALLLLAAQNLFAKPIIELDNKNPAHCIQQLEGAKDMFPIILGYATHCPFAQLFLPTYQQVAAYPRHADRDFFEFDYDGATRETIQQCLGLAPDVAPISPTINVVIQMSDPDTSKIVRTMPVHAWGGAKADPQDPSKPISISPAELEHIINIGPDELLLKSKLEKQLKTKQRG